MKSESVRNAQNAKYPISASKIREARRYIGCNVEDAANFLGVSKDEYSELEMHRSNVNRNKLEKLSKLYFRPLEFFIHKEQTRELRHGINSMNNASLAQRDIRELLKFFEFLSSVPKKQLLNGNQFNYRRLLTQTKKKRKGSDTAIELLRKLELAKDYLDNYQVDVFHAIRKMGLLLLFRPMKNLTGASVILGDVIGIILNSELPLEAQRHAAACELGRNMLDTGRKWSQDQVFIHSQLGSLGQSSNSEIEYGETLEFASNFLLPKDLLHGLMHKKSWLKNAMSEPENVYQASLRFGTSFKDTIHGLEREKLIGKSHREKLMKCKLNSLKKKLLGKKIPAASLKCANIWHLTENDNNTAIFAGLNDILLFDFVESPNTGFVWNFFELDRKAFSILDDVCISNSNATNEPPVRRQVIVRANKLSKLQDLHMQRKQPWKGGQVGETLTFKFQCIPC